MTQELPACDKQVREDHLLTSALGELYTELLQEPSGQEGGFSGYPESGVVPMSFLSALRSEGFRRWRSTCCDSDDFDMPERREATRSSSVSRFSRLARPV